MRGCLLSHAISSVSSTPGVASGVTRRSGKPWFFANRFIESSLSPKSLAIIRNCNHRSVQVVIRIFHPSYVYTVVHRVVGSPQADPKWTLSGWSLVLQISLDRKRLNKDFHDKARRRHCLGMWRLLPGNRNHWRLSCRSLKTR
jgi:hypothetical protein